ncbi:MAG: ATP-dependent RNA helicase HrpA [Victivallales bacterium]|nr:ATP-dependent RNA helicase HrpA [Victivallales bacterium]
MTEATEAILNRCREAAPRLRLRDRRELELLAARIAAREQRGQPVDRLRQRLDGQLERAEKHALAPLADRLKLDFPAQLPITARADEIAALLRQHQVLIVCGSTGSGKTTQLPKIALAAGRGRTGMIGCTQPRRIAAVSMAERVAEELGVTAGREVGCKVRFDDRTGEDTVVKFLTDGMLLAETRHDAELLQYDTLIIDEAHERSLNIDFVLGYLKNLLVQRPDLKVVVSSATLDAEGFAAFFGDAPVVQIAGRTYPVEDFFLPPEEDEDLSSHILRAVHWITDVDRTGDILVFLPGEREIRDAADTLSGQNWRNTEVLPLFARLSIGEQQRIFHPGRNRRIILATNVAETSITIPRIHYVIDSGMVRLSRFNPRNQVQELQIEQVSRAGAKQRRGRCGRLADGICVYLYDRDTYERSPEYTDPEIRRSSLAGVILRMAMLELPPLERFPLLDPPQSALVRDGYRTLLDLGAIDERHHITALGRDIAAFPLDPHLAAMIAYARKDKVVGEMLALTSFMSIMDPRERPAEKKQAADQAHRQWADEKSDFIAVLNLWNFLRRELAGGMSVSRLRRLCTRNFLNFRRVREWFNLFDDLLDTVGELGWGVNLPADRVFELLPYEMIHRAIIAGIPTHIARRDPEEKIYRGCKERKFYIFPGSGLFKKTPPWILSFELVETSRLFARKVAEIDPLWVEAVAPQLCRRIYENIRWERRRGFVAAAETVIIGGLVIHTGRPVHYGGMRPAEARQVFIRDAVVPGNLDTNGKWLQLHRQMLHRIEIMEMKLRRPGYLLDSDAVFAHFDHVLPPQVCSVKTLENWLARSHARIAMPLEAAVQENTMRAGETDFPDAMEFHGRRFPLHYRFDPGEADDGAMLLCPADQLNLLPEWLPEWGVPGWLAEKVVLLVRSLPKTVRIACNPVNETAAEFCAGVREGTIFAAQSLLQALADFLSDRIGQVVNPRDFSPDRLPGYLTLKIAELDENGAIYRITAGMPERSGAGSQVSGQIKGARRWIITGEKDWPGDELPEQVTLDEKSGTIGYPALADEGDTVGRQVFLDSREAAWSHRAGLIRLYRLRRADHIKYLRRNLTLSAAVKLTLISSCRYLELGDDLLALAVWSALTEDGRLAIRTADAFAVRELQALGELAGQLERHTVMLAQVVTDRDWIVAALHPVRDHDRFFHSVRDLREQLDFLFRPGFLRYPDGWLRYSRYLKAARRRVERMLLDPAKDAGKMAAVAPFQERFRIACDTVSDCDKSFDLQEFGLSLQEFRITVFAPEIRALEKISAPRLQKKWDEVRL